ncbi:hypothetical protein N7445_006143 [Penicillium cf. griseofulvum]|nr:hypothetical protein N7445_006143 [Penicillium cf. griseofulvum]
MSHFVGDWLNEAAAFRSFSTGTKNDQLFAKAVRIKHEVAQESQSKSIVIYQSAPTKRIAGSNLPDDLHISHNEGLSLLGHKQYSDATRALQTALELRENVLGTYKDTMISLSVLGDALSGQEKYIEAEAVYRDLWMRRNRAHGEKHTDTFKSLHKFSNALRRLQKYAEAEELGNLLQFQEKYAKAEEVYRQVWERRKAVLGGNYENTLMALVRLACVISMQDNHAQAERLQCRVYEGRRELLAPTTRIHSTLFTT